MTGENHDDLSCLVKCPFQNYTDYHGELFPDTSSCVPALTSEEWFAGSNSMVSITQFISTTNTFSHQYGIYIQMKCKINVFSTY